MYLCIIIFSVPVTFCGAMDDQQQGTFILERFDILDSLGLYMCDGLKFEWLDDIILGSLLSVYKQWHYVISGKC